MSMNVGGTKGGMQGLFGALDVPVSAMRAERQRMDVVLTNLANASSTRSSDGGPYKRRNVVFQEELQNATKQGEFTGAGVKVAEVAVDHSEGSKVFMPGHPDADATGYVQFPNVKESEEMVDLMTASRSFEANSAAYKIIRGTIQKVFEQARS
jgi:flagellar basal-body rod protein FlgC